MAKAISGGVAHDLPEDLRKALRADPPALARWETLTPLARNEWICWVSPRHRYAARRVEIVGDRPDKSTLSWSQKTRTARQRGTCGMRRDLVQQPRLLDGTMYHIKFCLHLSHAR